MKILICGASGFIGSNLANYLKDKHNILAVDNLKFSDRKNLDNDVQFLEKDFNDLSESFLDQFDTLIHMACANIIYAQDNHIDTFKINALDTINLFKKFEGKIIYTSTASVYGQAKIIPTTEDHPLSVSNAYDQSKLIAEKYLQLRGNYTTLRLSNVYGINQRPDNPYAGVIGKFINLGLNGKAMTIYGDGEDTRDYTYISDVVSAIMKAIKENPLNTEVNISTEVDTSINMLAYIISEISGNKVNIKRVNSRSIDTIRKRSLCNKKASRLLGWEPEISLTEGLTKTIAWQRYTSQ